MVITRRRGQIRMPGSLLESTDGSVLESAEGLDRAAAEANAQVAQSLYQQAISGKNTAATIFWLKTRAGWRESPAIEPRPVEIPPLIIQVYDEAA